MNPDAALRAEVERRFRDRIGPVIVPLPVDDPGTANVVAALQEAVSVTVEMVKAERVIANLLNDRLVVLERKVEEAREALDEHKRKWRHVAGCECHDKEQSNKCWSMDKSDGATQGKHTALWLHQHPHRDSRCSPATAESAQEVKNL